MNENLNLREYIKTVINNSEKAFYELISWGEKEKKQFSMLLEDLNKEGNTTKETGDKLERAGFMEGDETDSYEP